MAAPQLRVGQAILVPSASCHCCLWKIGDIISLSTMAHNPPKKFVCSVGNRFPAERNISNTNVRFTKGRTPQGASLLCLNTSEGSTQTGPVVTTTSMVALLEDPLVFTTSASGVHWAPGMPASAVTQEETYSLQWMVVTTTVTQGERDTSPRGSPGMEFEDH